LLYESDIDPASISASRVAVLGYGNQGHAQALNLRDHGVNVVVGARPGGDSWTSAVADGFVPLRIDQAAIAADVIVFTLPDETMAEIFRWHIAPHLRPGQMLLFAHGFNILFGKIKPPAFVDVSLVGPKGAGKWLRSEFVAGRGLAALFAIAQDATGVARERTLAYAWGIGCARGGLMETTFREETVTDLFGEQAVLCGGLPELIKAAFDTLVEAGYSPEAAYLEVCHEVKLITDLIFANGLHGMRDRISGTARYGGFRAGPRIVNSDTRAELRRLLTEIESGQFADEWIEEARIGSPSLNAAVQRESSHGIESAGARMRKDLPGIPN